MNRAFRHAFLLAALLTLPVLTGCGSRAGDKTLPVAASLPGARVQGIFMGGQQPIAGVSVQLYAVGTSGYGSAATPLLMPGSVLTTASGNFTFTSFTCPQANSLTYLVGTGGQPIAATQNSAAITNKNLALMVALGPCSNVANQFINVNEITTVASVWALAPFMTGLGNVGSSAGNAAGIQNAFNAVNKVTNTQNGALSGPALPANATLPLAEINTLADMLEQCVNSGGGSASDTTDGQTNGTGCGKLFYLAGGTSTTDTITAALNIAQNPARNVARLNLLRSPSPVFTPTLNVNTPPTDWTIAITYTGGGLAAPQGVAVDQSGNVWVANSGNSSVSEFSSVGTALSSSTGYTAGGVSVPYALAIDQAGNAWVANSGNNTITRITPGGAASTAFSGNGLNLPRSIAIDGAGNVFASNSNAATISGFTGAGAALNGSPYAGGGVNKPSALAINPR